MRIRLTYLFSLWEYVLLAGFPPPHKAPPPHLSIALHRAAPLPCALAG
jgi:hypothetical protein